MQIAANSIRSYTRKLNSYIVLLSSCSIKSAETIIKFSTSFVRMFGWHKKDRKRKGYFTVEH